MYERVKEVLKKIIPKDLLFRYEEIIRFPFAIQYYGRNHVCNICNAHLRKFIVLDNGEKICPYCGSLSRTRRLQKILSERFDLKGNVLHFSPSRSLYRRLKKNKSISYFSTDFENQFIADFQYDITSISVEDNLFDFIICYHILEHIENDKKAMSELYRVLKPNGILLIQTPFKDGEIYEDLSIKDPNERLHHFGQEDHVRVYSVEGLKNRLKDSNFTHIQSLEFTSDNTDPSRNGLLTEETILEVTK